MFGLLALLACSDPPAPVVAAPAAEARAADPWSKVALADGAVASATALPAFRNGAAQIACPVMGMAIDKPEDAVSYADYKGTRYYFCCDSCEKLFLADPETYADGKYLADHALDPTAPPACSEDAEAG